MNCTLQIKLKVLFFIQVLDICKVSYVYATPIVNFSPLTPIGNPWGALFTMTYIKIYMCRTILT